MTDYGLRITDYGLRITDWLKSRLLASSVIRHLSSVIRHLARELLTCINVFPSVVQATSRH